MKYLPSFFIIVTIVFTRLPAAAQSESPRPAPTNPAQKEHESKPEPREFAGRLSTDERVAVLEERVNLSLALKDEKIQSINERTEDVFKLLQFVGAFAAVVLVFFSIRDILFRWKEGQRQRGIDNIAKDMINLQMSAVEQQIRSGEFHLSQAEITSKQQFDAVQNVNGVIEVVRQTLAFRLEQEEKVAEAMREVGRIKKERERTKERKLAQALAILEHFKKMSRMQFSALTDEQYKRGVRLQDLVDDLDQFIAEQGFEIIGSMLYTCGVIAFYDNDIVEAKSYFDRAAETRASDHEGELLTNQTYRYRFAFIHYFRTLIHKNWGDLSEAKAEIEQSAKLLEKRSDEFLTPVTKGEIQSYIMGEEERCRMVLEELIKRIDALEVGLKTKGGELDSNQKKLRNRMLVLYGNTYVMQGSILQALAEYSKAIQLNPNDYYALASAAQCYKILGEEENAGTYFRQSLDAIERYGDLRRKRERITRAVIAVIAANSAAACGDSGRKEQYDREARELLSGNLTVEGMTPKFFSPSTKRLVSATDLLKEL